MDMLVWVEWAVLVVSMVVGVVGGVNAIRVFVYGRRHLWKVIGGTLGCLVRNALFLAMAKCALSKQIEPSINQYMEDGLTVGLEVFWGSRCNLAFLQELFGFELLVIVTAMQFLVHSLIMTGLDVYIGYGTKIVGSVFGEQPGQVRKYYVFTLTIKLVRIIGVVGLSVGFDASHTTFLKLLATACTCWMVVTTFGHSPFCVRPPLRTLLYNQTMLDSKVLGTIKNTLDSARIYMYDIIESPEAIYFGEGPIVVFSDMATVYVLISTKKLGKPEECLALPRLVLHHVIEWNLGYKTKIVFVWECLDNLRIVMYCACIVFFVEMFPPHTSLFARYVIVDGLNGLATQVIAMWFAYWVAYCEKTIHREMGKAETPGEEVSSLQMGAFSLKRLLGDTNLDLFRYYTKEEVRTGTVAR
ncbi:hypothetical protein NEDG_00804 [Nematocida displodere]|uniref:Uncharacterized protein n=1 Tax=Nematocida displodere TaxID=1805483 RepID=A0A177EDT8_9MICR|nr:hypothetical protein NEDG_00804 [Nematocida displodere]